MTYPHSIEIPKGSGSVYDASCRWQDMAFGQKVSIVGDDSLDADGQCYLPTFETGILPRQSFRLTLDSQTQDGEVVHVERVGRRTMLVGRLLDVPLSTTLGTISDLTVMAGENSGEALLLFTPPAGHTSMQAQVDGSDEGSATSETGAILLTGLAAGTYDFTVDATDGTTTTTSNAVSFEVV